jgi:hypothetical protein
MSFEGLAPRNLARGYADALESSSIAQGVNLPVNGVDTTAKVILKFL